jgi:hypothetical protein
LLIHALTARIWVGARLACSLNITPFGLVSTALGHTPQADVSEYH